MVKKEMYLKIKNMKKKGYSNSRIARELKIDRKTVRKYIKMNDLAFREYVRTRNCYPSRIVTHPRHMN